MKKCYLSSPTQSGFVTDNNPAFVQIKHLRTLDSGLTIFFPNLCLVYASKTFSQHIFAQIYLVSIFFFNCFCRKPESSSSEESDELPFDLELLPLILYFLFYESFYFILYPATSLSFSLILPLLSLSLASGPLLLVSPLDSRHLLLKS